VILHELETVSDVQLKFGAVEPFGEERQVLLGQFDHAIVDFHLVDGLDQRVFGHFSGDSAVTAAHDEHLHGRNKSYTINNRRRRRRRRN